MTEPTNKDRAQRAEQLIVTYAIRELRMDELCGAANVATLVSDMLADLMHYAARMHVDFRNCLDVAEMHFEAEAAQEGGAS